MGSNHPHPKPKPHSTVRNPQSAIHSRHESINPLSLSVNSHPSHTPPPFPIPHSPPNCGTTSRQRERKKKRCVQLRGKSPFSNSPLIASRDMKASVNKTNGLCATAPGLLPLGRQDTGTAWWSVLVCWVHRVCVCVRCKVCARVSVSAAYGFRQSGYLSTVLGARASTHPGPYLPVCRTYLTLPTSFLCSPWSALASPCLLPGRFWGRSFHLATPPPLPPPCRRAAKSLVRRRRRRHRRSRPTKGWLGTESWALQHGSTAPLHHCITTQCNPQRRAYGSNLRNSVGSHFRCPYPTAQVTFRPAQTYSH